MSICIKFKAMAVDDAGVELPIEIVVRSAELSRTRSEGRSVVSGSVFLCDDEMGFEFEERDGFDAFPSRKTPSWREWGEETDDDG